MMPDRVMAVTFRLSVEDWNVLRRVADARRVKMAQLVRAKLDFNEFRRELEVLQRQRENSDEPSA
jgi:hypothetical protein